MLKMRFRTNGKAKMTNRAAMDPTKENISKVIDELSKKYSDIVFIPLAEEEDFIAVLKEKGVRYMVKAESKTEPKSEPKVEPKSEPKAEPKDKKAEWNEKLSDENLSKEEFEKIMHDMMNEAGKQAAEKRDEELRKATVEEELKLQRDLKLLEDDVNRSFRLIGDKAVNKIINSTPNAAYYTLVKAMNSRIKYLEDLTDGEENTSSQKLKGIRDKLRDKAYNIEEYHNGFVNVLAKIGLFVMKLASIFLGIGKFAVDTLATSVVLLVRIGVSVTKEVAGAGRNIGRSFNKNVLGNTNAFNVDKYADDEEALNETLSKHEEQIARIKAKLAELQGNK